MKNVIRLLEWIESNLDKKLTTEVLSREAGCSPRYLGKIFHLLTGFTTAGYIRGRKLTLASFLLRDSSRPVTEIALMYGFEHVSSFSRAFKKYFNFSPNEYRRADVWDMRRYCPSAVIPDFHCFVEQVTIDSCELVLDRSNLLRVNFGFNFLLLPESEKFFPAINIFEHYVRFIFGKEKENEFAVIGNILPGGDCDVIIMAKVGQVSVSEKNAADTLLLAPGEYVCFSFVGNPYDIMKFHTWVLEHGLSKYGCIIKRGDRLTRLFKTETANIYKCGYYFPCVPYAEFLRHT